LMKMQTQRFRNRHLALSIRENAAKASSVGRSALSCHCRLYGLGNTSEISSGHWLRIL
jgi:hypothetical protein